MVVDPKIGSSLGVSLILGSGLGLLLGPGTILLYSFAVFAAPITASTGWDPVAVTIVPALAGALIGLLAPLAGRLIDRFGPRKILIFAALAQGAAVVSIGLVSHTYTMFVTAFVVASVISTLLSPIAYMPIVVGWFTRQRGLAIGIVQAFTGLGIATIPLVVAWLIAMFEWRGAFIVVGLATMTVILLNAIFILRDPPRPAPSKVAPGIAEPIVDGASFGEAVRTVSFWALFGAIAVTTLVSAGGALTLPALMVERGYNPSSAAAIMGGVGIAMIFSRIACGWLLDKKDTVTLATIVMLCPCLGFWLLQADLGLVSYVIAALLFGLAIGSEGDIIPYILAERFGRKDFSTIYGVHFLAYAISTGLGMLTFRLARTAFGDQLAFGVLAVASLVSVMLLLLVRREDRNIARPTSRRREILQ